MTQAPNPTPDPGPDPARLVELLEQLDDPQRPVRNAAAQALAAVGETVVPHLRPLLLDEPHDPDLAQLAVWILEQLDTPASEALLAAYWERHG